MAAHISFTDEQEQALRQVAAESLFLHSAHSEETATYLLDRNDFWVVVMGGRPNLPDPPSLPDSSPKRQQVEEEALDEHVPTLPRRNPPRTAKPQEPLLTEMSPDSLQRVEDKAMGVNVLKRPRRNPPRAAKSQEQEACPSLPDSRPKRPAEDEAPDGNRPKRPRIYRRDPVGACPYSRPLLPTRELVFEAMLNAPDQQMAIQDIKQYLQSHYPWFTWGSARRDVTTRIRQALGERRQALKRLEEVPGQEGYWRVKAEYLQYLSHLGSIPEE
ncbi:hypothetical protein INS49_007062 [Diaporthe citri]|uniref:uncharacterized protein n=1 Tax=Diaporthe citri TaxID=83186 RepID=UPI001C8273AC|nr:uncharacterized protein INS49_007062 [Diaporthe citri]KAG6365451.1 hypothetical protein INS49_007062 [Diaporthe citri]